MEREWYYKLEGWGEALGPFSFDELRQQAARGVIEPTTYIRKGERGRWVLADTVGALRREIITFRKRSKAVNAESGKGKNEITCPRCNGKVWDLDPKCPNCGCPIGLPVNPKPEVRTKLTAFTRPTARIERQYLSGAFYRQQQWLAAFAGGFLLLLFGLAAGLTIRPSPESPVVSPPVVPVSLEQPKSVEHEYVQEPARAGDQRGAGVDRVLGIMQTPNLFDPPSSGETQFVSPGSQVMTEQFRREMSDRIVRRGYSREEADAFTNTLNEEQQKFESRQR